MDLATFLVVAVYRFFAGAWWLLSCLWNPGQLQELEDPLPAGPQRMATPEETDWFGSDRFWIFAGEDRIAEIFLVNGHWVVTSVRLGLQDHDLHADTALEAYSRIAGLLKGLAPDRKVYVATLMADPPSN